MRKSICLCCLLATLLPALAQKPIRFSLRTTALDLTNCLANPGNVSIPLAPDDTNIELIDWRTGPTNKPHAGEFLITMKSAHLIGCIIVYGPGELSYRLEEDKWVALKDARENGRLLRFLVPDAGDLITKIKISVPARPREAANDKPTYQATLPFITLLPVRAINIAMNASVTVSSKASPDPKRPWLNLPKTLIDGFVDEQANFSSHVRSSPITPEFPEWVQLTFKKPQSIRGLVLFRGSAEHGFGRPLTEALVVKTDPDSGTQTEKWEAMRGIASDPGKFRSHELYVGRESIDAKAVRIRCIGGTNHIALGELAVLSDLGYAPVPR